MTAINPVFLHLMGQYKALCAAGQQHTEEASELFSQAYEYAPDDFKKMMHDKAVEFGLMPDQPDGDSDDGEPLYFMEKQCERLGIDPADVPEHLTRNAYHGTVHRVN
jgi:hypothetical protein